MPTISLRLTCIALVSFLVGACGGSSLGGEGGGLGGGGTSDIDSVVLTVGDESPRVGSMLRVIAELNGTGEGPLDGREVTFTIFPSEQSATARSNAIGRASADLPLPDASGPVEIVAQAEGIVARQTVQVRAGLPTSLMLDGFPLTVEPGGEVVLTATVEDRNGNSVVGEPVNFQLSGASPLGDFLNADGVTGDNGEATAIFRAGNDAGVQEIEARLNIDDGTGPIGDQLTVNIDPTLQVIGDIALIPGATSVSAGEAPVRLEAVVTDANGAPVVQRPVEFSLSEGSFDTSDDPTALDPEDRLTTVVTDDSGRAVSNFLAPAFVTNIRATANVGGVQREATIEVTPGQASAQQSLITANPQKIIADGESTSTLTVLLNDRFGNPLPDGRSVRLLASAGQFLGGSTQSLADGRASFTLQSSSEASEAVDVRVQDIPNLSTPLVFERLSNGDPAAIQFDASAERIDVAGVGGNEQVRIDVDVTDSAGRPIDESGYADPSLNNLRARFVVRPNGGEFLSGRNANGDLVSSEGTDSVVVRTSDGSATLSLQSGTLSGVVEIEFSVLEFDGQDFAAQGSIAARGSLPRVSIASGPPETIVFTRPNLNAIENLENGNYRLRGKVDVSDRFGNVVPDGTTVNFSLMDAVIAHGDQASIEDGDTAVTTDPTRSSLITFQCDDPTPANEADNCVSTQFNFGSTIQIENVPRGIEADDSVFLRGVEGDNRKRSVSSLVDNGILNVQTPFTETSNGVEYWVGASLRGATIAGIDADGNLVPGTGVVEDGIAEFRITYPANVGSILTGCYGYNNNFSYSTRDRRSAVPQSRQVVVSAESGQTVAANTAGDFCYRAIAGGRMILSNPDTAFIAPGQTQVFSLTLRDGGDDIRLPYVGFSCFVSDINVAEESNFSVTVTELPVNGLVTTNIDGVGGFEVRRSNPSPDTAEQNDRYTITCRSGEISASFDVGPS